MKRDKQRCAWAKDNELLIHYHDHEWGVPIEDDRLLFEFLILEGAQAGLNWLTVLKKRNAYRSHFDKFDPKKIAKYTDAKIKKLLNEPGIIRNRLKIHATIVNAKAYLELKKEWDFFSDYLWHFIDGKSVRNRWRTRHQVPDKNNISDQLSKDLKKRGFKFVGSTICYAFMQAIGMVNDHTIDCFRHRQIDTLMKKRRAKKS